MDNRASEFTTEIPIYVYCGTFNLNGQTAGIEYDLSQWLRPSFLQQAEQQPELVVVGFQEIVELSPQQIMATNPERRKLWERALLKCLNQQNTKDPYILLRGGQLVGAALLIFVRSSVIGEIKNVEGSLKKVWPALPALHQWSGIDQAKDWYVWSCRKQGRSSHPIRIRQHAAMFCDSTSCRRFLKYRRKKQRLHNHF